MAAYRVTVDGRPYEVEIEDEAPGRCRVTVDGRAFAVEVDASGAAAAAAPRIEPLPSAGIASRPVASAPRPAPAPTSTSNGNGATVLRAPMPGLILRVSVAPGAKVQRGQDIAVLEAMKMENVVRAPQAGTIAEVCVAPGQQVPHGAPIVRFEAGGAPA